MIIQPTEKLQKLNSIIQNYEDEIQYLEDLLCSTVLPAQEIIDELAENREKLAEFRTIYSSEMKKIQKNLYKKQ